MTIANYAYSDLVRAVGERCTFDWWTSGAPIARDGFYDGVQHCTLVTFRGKERTFTVLHGDAAPGSRQAAALVAAGGGYAPLGLEEGTKHVVDGLAGVRRWEPSKERIDRTKAEVERRKDAEEAEASRNREAAEKRYLEREEARLDYAAYHRRWDDHGMDR